jgi:lycopene cyclase domain-containing protein
MAKWVYLLLNLGTFGAALVMGRGWKQEWLQYWRTAIVAVCSVALPFLVWDMVATHRGHWAFSKTFTLGPELLGLPIEEYLFFIVVGLACIALWEQVQRQVPRAPVASEWLLVPYGLAAVLLWFWWGREYTMIVGLVGLTVIALLMHLRRRLLTRAWLVYQAVLLGLFALFNSILTALPVVTYGSQYYSGVRLETIPLEDVLYNFVLTNLVIVAYLAIRRHRAHL